MIRIVLFLITNLAVMLLLGIIVKLFGIETYLAGQGVGMNLNGLLIMAGVFGMGGSIISLLISKWTAKRMMGLQVIEQPRDGAETWLLKTVTRQAQEAGIGVPEVAMYDSPDLNAFATGANRNHALVAVSTGLLQRMRREEVEAVLGHEMSHVANGDMVTLALIQGVVNTFVFFLSRVIGQLVDRAVFRNERGHGPGFWITTMIAQMVLGVLAMIIVMWFSRWREFRADSGGAKLAGREKMIRALERLGASVQQEPMPEQLQAFGIAGKPSGLARLFMSHPPIEERIAALRALYT
ncbi:MAG: protease HtpX [Gammaproteobacteria bacterium]